jgi:hypothetical protein
LTWWRHWAPFFQQTNSDGNNNTTTSCASIIAPPPFGHILTDVDEAQEPESIIPVGTSFLSIIVRQLTLVGFGFLLNLIALAVFLPGLNVPRRAQVLMSVGCVLNIIVAWHLVVMVELDVVV